MSEVVDTPAATAAPAAPAAAPVAPSPAPAAPAPAAAPATLFSATPPAPAAAAATTVPASAPADPLAWLPEKFRVNGADGKFDLDASSRKLADSYTNLEKHRGTGAPAKPEDYTFEVPEQYKEISFDHEANKAFRQRAHAKGLSQEQFDWVMGEYFEMVPAVLDGAAKYSADQARGELQKVWKTQPEFDSGMSAAERAVSLMPPELQAKVKEKYGTDPVFWEFAAQWGKESREDRSATPPAGNAGTNEVEALMASAAYKNPKDPQHAAVSARVQEFFRKRYGESPAT